MITLGIRNAVEKIVSDISNYESDTFTTYGDKLTPAEARAIAERLITSRVDIGENVDGVTLSVILDEIRQ